MNILTGCSSVVAKTWGLPRGICVRVQETYKYRVAQKVATINSRRVNVYSPGIYCCNRERIVKIGVLLPKLSNKISQGSHFLDHPVYRSAPVQ